MTLMVIWSWFGQTEVHLTNVTKIAIHQCIFANTSIAALQCACAFTYPKFIIHAVVLHKGCTMATSDYCHCTSCMLNLFPPVRCPVSPLSTLCSLWIVIRIYTIKTSKTRIHVIFLHSLILKIHTHKQN